MQTVPNQLATSSVALLCSQPLIGYFGPNLGL